MSNLSLPSIQCIQWFHFPENCCVDQRIGKALFADNGPLTPADRRTFRNEIEEICCSYVLDENHGVMLTPYSDTEHDYTCLAQIDVFLKKPGKAVRVAELCHRAMPYPLIVILHDGESLMFSMAEKRFSRDGKEQVVLERCVHTDWLEPAALTAFHAAAAFPKFRKASFRELYSFYFEMLEALNCSRITGILQTEGVDPVRRRELLTALHQLQIQLDELKAKAKKESELARLVEFNMQAKRINHEIHEIHEKLK